MDFTSNFSEFQNMMQIMNNNMGMNNMFNTQNNNMMMNFYNQLYNNPMMMNSLLNNFNNNNYNNNNFTINNQMNLNQMLQMMINSNPMLFWVLIQGMMNSINTQNAHNFQNTNRFQNRNNNNEFYYNLLFINPNSSKIPIQCKLTEHFSSVVNKYINKSQDYNINIYIFNGVRLDESKTLLEQGIINSTEIYVVKTKNILGAI